MTEHYDIREVQAMQQVAIDSGDQDHANALYAKELALRSDLGQEQVEGAPPRSFLPKSSETSPGDYLSPLPHVLLVLAWGRFQEGLNHLLKLWIFGCVRSLGLSHVPPLHR